MKEHVGHHRKYIDDNCTLRLLILKEFGLVHFIQLLARNKHFDGVDSSGRRKEPKPKQ